MKQITKICVSDIIYMKIFEKLPNSENRCAFSGRRMDLSIIK